VHAFAHADPPALIRVIEDVDSTIGSAPGLSAFNDRLRIEEAEVVYRGLCATRSAEDC
jgi:hypothetical protein